MDIDLIHQNLAKANLVKAENKTEQSKDKKLKEAQLKEATQGFEAIFLQTLIKSMRSTLPGNALFEDSNDMDIYKSMYDQYLAEDLSKNGSPTGIGKYLYEQLKNSI